MSNTQAYLYKWTQHSTSKWYIGSRTKRGCHPADGYICSSKIKSLILETYNDWTHEILAIGDPTYIRKLEADYLDILDAKNDPYSFNLHNGDGNFTTAGSTVSKETRQKIQNALKGTRTGSNNPFYGKKHTAESITKSTKFGPANGLFGKTGNLHPAYGKTKSAESRSKISKAKQGDNHPCHKPHNQITCEHCGLTTQKTNYVRWHGSNCKQLKGLLHVSP